LVAIGLDLKDAEIAERLTTGSSVVGVAKNTPTAFQNIGGTTDVTFELVTSSGQSLQSSNTHFGNKQLRKQWFTRGYHDSFLCQEKYAYPFIFSQDPGNALVHAGKEGLMHFCTEEVLRIVPGTGINASYNMRILCPIVKTLHFEKGQFMSKSLYGR